MMGTSPENSVVNKYLQSWDVPNLFVVGASAFPQLSSFNPYRDSGSARLSDGRCHKEQIPAPPRLVDPASRKTALTLERILKVTPVKPWGAGEFDHGADCVTAFQGGSRADCRRGSHSRDLRR